MAIDKMNPAAAAGAYANIQKTVQSGGVSAGDTPSFADILKTGITNAIDSVKAGEKASAGAITGNVTSTELVQALTQAELTLQTTTAVRDRMVNAYQDIMRMPI